jgi:broad specificity phosphatase PhoE
MLELHAQTSGAIALFTHGDPIRPALQYWLGIPTGFYKRIEISPGSYSIIRIHDHCPEVLGINVMT